MARSERPDEPAIPVIDAELGRAWADARAPRPSSPRGRLTARLAAGSLVALVAAVGVLGGAFDGPAPDPASEPSPTAAELPPAARPGEATADPDACRAVDVHDIIPAFRLATEDDPIGERGLQGVVDAGDEPTPGPWQVLPALPALEVPLDGRLHLVPATGVCVVHLDVHAVSLDARTSDAGDPRLVHRGPVDRGAIASFRATAAGPWSLRIQARYWTGEGRPPAGIEMFFRVVVGAVPPPVRLLVPVRVR